VGRQLVEMSLLEVSSLFHRVEPRHSRVDHIFEEFQPAMETCQLA